MVAIFPNTEAALRLVGLILVEIMDEWQADRRYFSLELMNKLKEPDSMLPRRSEPTAVGADPLT